MRRILIDGHNLILTVPALAERVAYDGKRASREALEEMVFAWAGKEGEVVVRLIYDGSDFPGGHPGNREEGEVTVRFVDPPAEADDMIAYEAREATERGETVTVVTGDRGLAARVTGAGVRILGTSAFFRDLSRARPEPEKEERFTGEEIRRLEREMLARPAPPIEDAPAADVRVERAPIAAPPAIERDGTPRPAKHSPAKAASPPVPGKEDRRARFRKKEKRRAAARPERKRRSGKKRRGF